MPLACPFLQCAKLQPLNAEVTRESQLGNGEPSLLALKLKPDADQTYRNIAVAYSKLGRHQEAIEAYKQVVRINPQSAEALHDLGLGYSSAGQWQEAMDSFKKAVSIKPNLAQAHYGLAAAYLNLGNRAAAIEEYEVLRRLDPNLASKLSQAIQQ